MAYKKNVGLAPSTLAKLRVRGDGPPYSKAGARIVVYDIDEWLRATRRAATRSIKSTGKV
jgi:hypothetical protein